MPNDQLVSALRAAVGGDAVSTDTDDLTARSHDLWPLAVKWARRSHHPFPAEVVVRAADAGRVVAVLGVAGRFGVPVTPWGRGSSVTGAPLPVHGGIVLDLSGLTGPERLDETDLTVTVPAGVLGGDLERRLNARGYTLGHSPQSLDRSSVGGWLATRAVGQFSSRYGAIEDLVVDYTVVLASGETLRLSASPRAALGPDLRQLFLGSEGTLGVITEATLKVFPLPPHRVTEAFRLDTVDAGLESMRQLTRAGLRPFLVRCYDQDEAPHALGDPAFRGCLLFLGHEGVRAVAEEEHAAAVALVAAAGGTSLGAGPVEGWLRRRFDFSLVERSLQAPGGFAETIEVAHRWSGIGQLYTALKKDLEPLAREVLGHFSHVYPQGTSLYVILLGEAGDDLAAQARLDEIWRVAMESCLQYGGELSHHHGAGLARQPYLERGLRGSLGLLQRVKDALDPAGTLNPGKLGLRRPAGQGGAGVSGPR